MQHYVILLLFDKRCTSPEQIWVLKNKGPCGPLSFDQKVTLLLVVYVHGNFETKTNVIVFWGFPFHDYSPYIYRYRLKIYWYHQQTLGSENNANFAGFKLDQIKLIKTMI